MISQAINAIRRTGRSQKGFTLLEVVVVVAILAILVGLVLPNLSGIIGNARTTMVQGQLEKAREASFFFHADTGTWPDEYSDNDGDGYRQLTNGKETGGSLVTNWDGPYFERPFLSNGWGGVTRIMLDDASGRAHLNGYDFDISGTATPGSDCYLYFSKVPRKVCKTIDKKLDGTTDNYNHGTVIYHQANPSSDECGLGILIASAGISTISSPPLPSDWYDADWSCRKKITIDHDRVEADLNNFPVLVNLPSDSGLATGAQDDGDDILFTKSDGLTKLSHELEEYSSGTLVTWVEVPLLSSTSDTTLYMYYGNPSCPSQQDTEDVWDSNFKMVQHLEETSGTHYDSTSNDDDGIPHHGVAQNVTGRINGADGFDGSDDYLNVAESSSLQITTPGITIEAWVNITAFSGTHDGGDMYIVNKITSSNKKGYGLLQDTYYSRRKVGFYIGTGSANRLRSTTELTANNWYHLTGTYDGSKMRIYLNGELDNSQDLVLNITNAQKDLYIGNNYSGTTYLFNGKIDEVRISDVARGGNWIKTCYNNQNSPATFYSLGSEQHRS